MIKITLNTDNAAFDDDPIHEIKRILTNTITTGKLEDYEGKKLYDINGNPVGIIRTKPAEIRKTYKAEGIVAGTNAQGSIESFVTHVLEKESKEDIEAAIKKELTEPFPEDSYGFREAKGAVMRIYTIEHLKRDRGKPFKRETFVRKAYGDLTPEEQETLADLLEDL